MRFDSFFQSSSEALTIQDKGPYLDAEPFVVIRGCCGNRGPTDGTKGATQGSKRHGDQVFPHAVQANRLLARPRRAATDQSKARSGVRTQPD